MAASQARRYLQQFCPEHRLTCKLAQSGMYNWPVSVASTDHCRIYKQAKPATQSGSWGSHAWRMDWDPLAKGHRWENPLMGWQSSADAMQGTKINFKTKEDAIAFAEKQGYEFYVSVPQERRFVPKAYANNFLHEPGPLKHIKTK